MATISGILMEAAQNKCLVEAMISADGKVIEKKLSYPIPPRPQVFGVMG